MVTLILPGYSAKNESWVKEVANNLKVEGQIRPVYWEHWKDKNSGFNPKEKAELLSKHSKGETVNIVAKSAGILVGAYVTKQIPSQINRIILCGIPSTSEARLVIFKEAFANISSDRLLVIQNTSDPFETYKDVSEFIAKVNPNIKIIEKNGSDHNYPYFEDFHKFLSS